MSYLFVLIIENDSISNDSARRSSFQTAQGHWYSQLNLSVSSLLTTTTASTAPLSTTIDQEHYQQGIPPSKSKTMCISSDDDSEKH